MEEAHPGMGRIVVSALNREDLQSALNASMRADRLTGNKSRSFGRACQTTGKLLTYLHSLGTINRFHAVADPNSDPVRTVDSAKEVDVEFVVTRS